MHLPLLGSALIPPSHCSVAAVAQTSVRGESLVQRLRRLQATLRTSKAVDVAATAALLSLALPLGSLLTSGTGYLGLDPSALHKLLLVACTLPIFLGGGLRHWFNPVIVAATLLLLLGLTVGSRLQGLSLLQSVQSYAALILGVYLFELRLGDRIVRWLVRLMPWAALANLGAALALWSLDGRLYYRWFYGAFRLTGLGNPAILSAIALGAMMFSLLASLRRPAWIWLAAVNYLIVVWSGTRTRVVEGAILLLGWAVVLFISMPREGRRVPKLQTTVLTLAVPVALLSYSSHLSERLGGYVEGAAKETLVVSIPRYLTEDQASISGETGDEDAWNVSLTATGRMNAWSYYWDVFQESPWFGNGVGASIVAGTGVLHPAFRQPHNDYLRILVDGGIVGLCLMVGGHLLVLKRLLRSSRRTFRRWLIVIAFGVLAAGALVQSELSSLGFNVPFWLFVGILAGELPDLNPAAGAARLRPPENAPSGA